MPFHAPGSLSDYEVYALTAFILGEAEIIGRDDVMNAEALPQVQMPNSRRLRDRSAPGRVQLRLRPRLWSHRRVPGRG